MCCRRQGEASVRNEGGKGRWHWWQHFGWTGGGLRLSVGVEREEKVVETKGLEIGFGAGNMICWKSHKNACSVNNAINLETLREFR